LSEPGAVATGFRVYVNKGTIIRRQDRFVRVRPLSVESKRGMTAVVPQNEHSDKVVINDSIQNVVGKAVEV
jgi:hypothetical protein